MAAVITDEEMFYKAAKRCWESGWGADYVLKKRGWQLIGRGSSRTVYAKDGVAVKLANRQTFCDLNREEYEVYNKYYKLRLFPKLLAVAKDFSWIAFVQLPLSATDGNLSGFYTTDNDAARARFINRVQDKGFKFDNAQFNLARDATGHWKIVDLVGFCEDKN